MNGKEVLSLSDHDISIFVEQAEYIPTAAFQKWNTEHPEEESIIKKLSQWGAKLIIGPRGCGKTTLLLKAYDRLSKSNGKAALPVYVNFKSSLKVEPLYKTTYNAVFWFNQWILLKVYQGLFNTLKDMNIALVEGLKLKKKYVDQTITKIEFGQVHLIKEDNTISIEILEDDIRKILDVSNKSHCVLLLDDAAHAFSSEQQRDFFDFFRQVKSKVISPKAAVYPGVTIYSSTFHIGHDAEEINVWIRPDSPNYLEFMTGLLERRLPSEVFKQLVEKRELLEVVCYSAFGLPRTLLNMVRNFYKENSDEEENKSFDITFDKSVATKAISESLKQTLNIYASLKAQLPTYEKFINTGSEIFTKMIDLVKEWNKGKDVSNQSVTIAISRPIPAELLKVLGFFQYAGLLLPKGDVSKGEKGVFELYSIHYSALVERNVFMSQTSISISNLLVALSKRNAHSYTRTSTSALIGTENIAHSFPLSLPPCQSCKEPRTSEHSKFCPNCGAQLKTVSIFESLVSNNLTVLPLTPSRIQTIIKHSNIRTIKDILMDTENRELRKVPQIGPVWAQRMYSYAEEYLV